MTDKTIIGQRIAELRKAMAMTQAELADKLGVSHQAVSQWERSETLPDILTLPLIAQILGVSINSLLGLEDGQPNKEEKNCSINADGFSFPQSEETVDLNADSDYEIVLIRDGKIVRSFKGDPDGQIKIVLAGSCRDLHSEMSVSVEGNVEGDATSGFGMTIGGDVGGNASSGFEMRCGNVGGHASAGFDLHCATVDGQASGGFDALASLGKIKASLGRMKKRNQKIHDSALNEEEVTVDGNTVTINGNYAGDLSTAANVTVYGNVEGDVDADGSVSVGGDINGDVSTNGNVSAGGDINGDVETNDTVSAGGDINGDVDTDGTVTVEGDVNGDVSTSGDVRIAGDANGDVRGNNVTVEGNCNG